MSPAFFIRNNFIQFWLVICFSNKNLGTKSINTFYFFKKKKKSNSTNGKKRVEFRSFNVIKISNKIKIKDNHRLLIKLKASPIPTATHWETNLGSKEELKVENYLNHFLLHLIQIPKTFISLTQRKVKLFNYNSLLLRYSIFFFSVSSLNIWLFFALF